MNADGTDQTNVTNSPAGRESEPSWQSLPTTAYSHPQSASSLQVSIVPAFNHGQTEIYRVDPLRGTASAVNF